MRQALKTFIIYARSDESAKTQLLLHLRPLINNKMLTIWHDGNILPGEDWEKAIKKELKSSNLVLLLVSANSLNSDFIQSEELKTALERLQEGLTRVIPIIMSPCAWRFDPIIAGLQALPKYRNEGPKPVIDRVWQNDHEAWTNVVENLGDMINELNIQRENSIRLEQEQKEQERKRIEEAIRQLELQEKQRIEDANKKTVNEQKKKAEELEFSKLVNVSIDDQRQVEGNHAQYLPHIDDKIKKYSISDEYKYPFWSLIIITSLVLLGWGGISFYRSNYKSSTKEELSKKDNVNNSLPFETTSSNFKPVDEENQLSTSSTARSSNQSATTPQTITIEKPFAYIKPDKMSFYVGVNYPITVISNGISSNIVKVTAKGATVSSKSNGRYDIMASSQGECQLTISGSGITSSTYSFKVKKIPDPVAKLSRRKGGAIGNGEFRAQSGISAILEGFDFDVKCTVVSYNMYRLPRHQDPYMKYNDGARFSSEVQKDINRARPGDFYLFTDIKCTCQGDISSRDLGSMAFEIK